MFEIYMAGGSWTKIRENCSVPCS